MAEVLLPARAARSLPAEITTDLLVEVLARTPFLASVHHDKLVELVKKVPLRRYEAGEKVVVQGEYGHSLFVVVKGALRVYADTEYGEHVELGELDHPSAYFGEMALLGRRRRSATVESTAPTILLELEKTRLERLDLIEGGVIETLERLSEERSIRAFVENHRFLSAVGPKGTEELVAASHVRVYERGTEVFRAGDPARHVLLVKTGVAKLIRRREQVDSVLAYFNTGDVVGLGSGEVHAASLVSMGYLEVVETPRKVFLGLKRYYPQLTERFQKDVAERIPRDQSGDLNRTMAVFIEEFIGEGAQEGLSLLTIDLDKCVRCGNCVSACDARHGHARVTRRGKKLVRRVQQDKPGEHQTILIPSSCRHCSNPECMIGCPTGAIHRRPGGEVDIKDFCIGCGSCANRCPYGNITMLPTPARMVDGVLRDKIANKCNLCAGFDEANCVHNCPTGAILRVEPTSYFEELSQVLGRGAQQGVGDAATARKREISKLLVPLLMLLVAGGLGALARSTPGPYSPWSMQGLALGAATFVAMLGAVGLAARRRLMKSRHQLGAFRLWTRVHVWLGLLSLVALFLHSNGRLGGPLTAALTALAALEVATGLFGLAFYKWLPRVITRIEGESQVEEDVREERGRVQRRVDELLEGAPEAARKLAGRMRGRVASVWSHYRAGRDREQAVVALRQWLRPRAAELADDQQRTLERIASDLVRLQEIRACLRLYGVRRGWLALHIGVTAMLMTLAVVHVVSVFWFRAGGLPT